MTNRTPLTVESLGADRYRVSGGTEPHLVLVHPNGPLCDCKSFAHRGQRSCKHVAAVVEFQEYAVPFLALLDRCKAQVTADPSVLRNDPHLAGMVGG